MLRAEQEGVRNSSFLQMENKPKKLDQKKGVGGGEGCLITKTPFLKRPRPWERALRRGPEADVPT